MRTLKQFPNYKIDRDGTIINKTNNRKIFGHKYSSGLRIHTLIKNGKTYVIHTHVLLAKTFLPNPNKYKNVIHINGLKWDNRLENLRWGSDEEIYKIN